MTLSLLIIFFLPIKDTDFGWHYRCGEEFLTQRKLCLTNEFSYFLSNYQWANPNFLYDISLAFIFDHFGFIGLSVLGSLIFATIFLLLFKLLKGEFWFKVLALLAIIFLCQNVFPLGYRPQILGLLFLVIELTILEGPTLIRSDLSKVGPLKTLLLLILFWLWANSHPSFFLGPLVLTVFLTFKLINKIISALKQRNSNTLVYRSTFNFNELLSPIIVYSLLLLPSILVTFLNPFGWRIYLEVWQHFQSPLNTMIAEWVAPDSWQILLIVLLTILIFYLTAVKKIPLDFRLFLLLIFAYFAISARRNLPLYYIIAFWLLSEINLNQLLNQKINRTFNWLALGALAVSAIVSVFLIGQTNQTLAFDVNSDAYCNRGLVKLPCQAAEYLQDKTGNLFNMYEQGGYLIWKLPQMKVFADGRMPAWKDEKGMSPYQVYLSIIQTQKGWNEKLKQYQINYLLINRGTYLDLLLQEKNPAIFGWKEEYEDSLSIIYSKI